MSITIRDGTLDDSIQIRTLLYDLGSDHLTNDDIWRWEFFGLTIPPIIKMAYDEKRGRIAGHYGLIPMTFNFMGNVFSGGKIEGSATHPEYRGKELLKLYPEMKSFKVFRELVRSLVQDVKKRDLDLVFGFPNEAAKKTQYENGFQEAPIPFNHYVRVYSAHALLENKLPGAGTLKKMAIGLVLRANGLLKPKADPRGPYILEAYDPEKHDVEGLCNSFVKMKNVISIHRDKRYMKWRYTDNPVQNTTVLCALGKNGELCGLIAFGYRSNGKSVEGKIDDILYDREDPLLIKQMLSAAIADLERRKVDFISGMVTGDKFKILDKSYRKLGFFPKRRIELNFFYVSDKLKKYGVDFEDVNNWYLNFSFRQY